MTHVLDEAIDRLERVIGADWYNRTRADSDDVDRVRRRAARHRAEIRSLIAALRVLRRERDERGSELAVLRTVVWIATSELWDMAQAKDFSGLPELLKKLHDAVADPTYRSGKKLVFAGPWGELQRVHATLEQIVRLGREGLEQ